MHDKFRDLVQMSVEDRSPLEIADMVPWLKTHTKLLEDVHTGTVTYQILNPVKPALDSLLRDILTFDVKLNTKLTF